MTQQLEKINHEKNSGLNKRILVSLEKVKFIIANSKFTKRLAITIGLPEKKIHIIHPGHDEPLNIDSEFKRESELKVRPIFQASLSEDRKGIKRAAAVREGANLDKADSFKKWFALAFGDALVAASRDKLFIHRQIMKTINLVEKPGDFLKNKKIQRTVLLYMLRGRKRNSGSRIQPGLTRPTMMEFLTELTSNGSTDNQADKSLPKAAASAS